MIHNVLEKQQFITLQSLNFDKYLVLQEILKMFMNQIPSLIIIWNFHKWFNYPLLIFLEQKVV